jgi:hypothetical protein
MPGIGIRDARSSPGSPQQTTAPCTACRSPAARTDSTLLSGSRSTDEVCQSRAPLDPWTGNVFLCPSELIKVEGFKPGEDFGNEDIPGRVSGGVY